MNQSTVMIRLAELTESSRPFGNAQGKEVFSRLSARIDAHPRTAVFCISLKGIKATDASFPRESVVSVAKQFRGEKGLCLVDIEDRDLIDNWKYACQAKEQPLVIWHDNSWELIGPDITQSSRQLLDYVLQHRCVLASQVATDLGISVQNASTRLKRLVQDGYILRSEDVAPSGGVEYRYSAIH